MRAGPGFRKCLIAATAALTVTGSAPPQVVFAQTARSAASDEIIDGVADAATCAAHGYAAPGRPAMAYAVPSPAMRVAPPPPPPPPPPRPMAPPAAAADSAASEGVTVVGSIIRGVAPTGANVSVYTKEDLERTGLSSMKQLLLETPMFANGAANAGGRAPPSLAPPPPLISVPNTERYPGAAPNPIHQVAAEPVSTFSIDVDTASYANVRRFLNDGQRPPAEAVRVEEMMNYFDYGYATPKSLDAPFQSTIAVAPSPWAAGKQLIHIGVQGFRPAKGQEPPLNLVFLVDTSGSMMSDDRLPLAQRALNVLIDQLRPQDHVAMVAYAGSAGQVLAPTSGREKLKMRCAVNALEAGGSTAGGAGLSLAYALAQAHFNKQGVNRIVLMTDGDFNVGVTSNKTLEQFVADKRKTGVYLSIYGYGRGNYQDERMQVIAQNGNGTAAYVDSLKEARRIFERDFEGSMFPIADDVKLQVEFNPARVAEYRLIGYETRLLQREDFNNDQVDAGEVGAGVAVTALYEITPVGGPVAIDPLRYGAPESLPMGGGISELAYLKIRYKPAGGQTSRLIEQPIGSRATYASLDQAPEATRWAVAVAGFGQKLAGDSHMSDAAFSWDADLALARSAKGDDPDGMRAEFLDLVRAAKALPIRSAAR